MSLINRQTLIAPCCAGTLLDLDESSLRKGIAGDESLRKCFVCGEHERCDF